MSDKVLVMGADVNHREISTAIRMVENTKTILVHDEKPKLAKAFLAAAMMAATSHNPIFNVRYSSPKQERKCLLKGCEEMTTHNGGYCCAEHCKQAKGQGKSLVQ